MTDETLYSALHWAKKAEYWAGQAAQGQIQADWAQTDNTKKDFIKNKPTIPAAQVNSDWNATTGIAQILNKPTKLSDFTDDTATNPVSRATGDSDGNSIKNTYATKSQLSGEKSNCITEIPQDIKLELDNGTLTLKAGSKVYVPNGAGVFEEKTLPSDLVKVTSGSDTDTPLLFVRSDLSSIETYGTHRVVSGGSDSQSGTTYHTWYDTSNNTIKRYDSSSSTAAYTCSLPVALLTRNNGAITSIDQVFNGFGYIGSTVFALPGVKGLIPNGRNADGSMNNTEYTNIAVLTNTLDSGINDVRCFVLTSGGTIRRSTTYSVTKDNYLIQNDNGEVLSAFEFAFCPENASGKIGRFSSKQVFNAIDLNDGHISGIGMPSNKYINLTLGASGTNYEAPANGWFTLRKQSTAANQYLLFGKSDGLHYQVYSQSSGTFIGGFYPSKRGEKVSIQYSLGGTADVFRFVYAEGDV